MKKLFVRAIAWLRSRVTAMTKREKGRVRREVLNNTSSVRGEDASTRPAAVAYDQTSFGPPATPAGHGSTLLLAEEYIKEQKADGKYFGLYHLVDAQGFGV